MAAFGARYFKFSRIKSEEPGKLPAYDPDQSITLGLVKADLTVTYASGDLYADDKMQEKIDEFVSAAIAAETDELKDEDAVILYGSTLNEQKEKVDNSADSAPAGGLGYYKSLMKNRKKFYRGYYYPKVVASIGNDNAATKSSSITFSTTPITITVMEPDTGDWRYTKEFPTAAEVRAWVDAKLGEASAGGNTGGEV